MSWPLEPQPAEAEAMGRLALARLVDFLARRPDAPAVDLDGAFELGRALALEAPPADGRSLDELLDLVDAAAAKAIDTAGPGFLAYIPGGGLFAAALGDFLACGINRYVTRSAVAPVAAGIESSVVRWLCGLFGLPDGAQGILTSGGSLANFSAIVAARERHLGEDLRDATLYVSDQAHHSLIKAARLAGLPASAVRRVPTDERLRIDPGALAEAIATDRAAGRRPFLVAASAGTTNTGAIDPLPAIADVARDEGLWLHADAAYGGFFRLTDRGRARLAGVERADSITLDPHKGMFLPYGTGALLVRDRTALAAAHSFEAAYLRDLAGDPALPDFTELSPELSRDFRGLRVWLPLHLHGVQAFRAALDEKLDLARRLFERLREVPELELPWDPELTVVTFRPASGDDAAGRRLLERINRSGRIFLSPTETDAGFVLRACVLSHRTHAERVDEAAEIIAAAARAEAEAAG